MKKVASLVATTVWLILISLIAAQQPLKACGIASQNLNMAPNDSTCIASVECHVAFECENGQCYGATQCPNCGSNCIGWWQECVYYPYCGAYTYCSDTAVCT